MERGVLRQVSRRSAQGIALRNLTSAKKHNLSPEIIRNRLFRRVMKIDKKCVERLLLTLAFFTEIHPDANPKVNEFYKGIRDKHANDCLKYGKCEMCGEEELLGECGLTWVCERAQCLETVKKLNDEEIKKFRRRLDAQASYP